LKILETNFGHGESFLRHWAGWRGSQSASTALLHYVALVPQPVDFAALRQLSNPREAWAALATELAAQCDGLVPGFHRLMFEGGKVLLTLCVGDLKGQLKALQFEADAVVLTDPPRDEYSDSPWDIWAVKLLAKCCRRGTTLTCTSPSPELLTRLLQCGFETTQPLITTWGDVGFVGRYNPRWEPKNARVSVTRQSTPTKPGDCMVIGAGLAGASVAASLARRGWQVTVLDAAAEPAMEASGLPVGLMVPHATADDSPRSRLSRRGMRMTLQQATTLLTPGQDWEASGVLERRLAGALGLPADWLRHIAHGGAAWTRSASDDFSDSPTSSADSANDSIPWRNGLPRHDPALWHGKAAWIKPASLVRAWLAQPGIQFQGNSPVASLVKRGHQWVASDAHGQRLAEADLVVIANAGGAVALLAQLTASMPKERLTASALAQLQTVQGQVSWAVHRQQEGQDDAHQFPPFPVNGLGSLVAHVPMSDSHSAWFAGATFEREGDVVSVAAGHQANLARLQTLLPAGGQVFANQLAQYEVQAWRNTRCTSTDRMPLCGPLTQGDGDWPPSLWLVSALGARGLSLAVLCAELLAARVHQEPLPIEVALAQVINIDRKKCLKSPSVIDS
jgi:tRNA 5-methylaminomethyl-2-thiouridine biosynthesis bifunctional protein